MVDFQAVGVAGLVRVETLLVQDVAVAHRFKVAQVVAVVVGLQVLDQMLGMLAVELFVQEVVVVLQVQQQQTQHRQAEMVALEPEDKAVVAVVQQGILLV